MGTAKAALLPSGAGAAPTQDDAAIRHTAPRTIRHPATAAVLPTAGGHGAGRRTAAGRRRRHSLSARLRRGPRGLEHLAQSEHDALDL